MALPVQSAIEGEEPADQRFVRGDGFLLFTGSVATEDVPDHRLLREERIDALMNGTDEGRP